MRIPFMMILLALQAGWLYAGDGPYPAASIPEKLKKDAHAVKRMEAFRFTVVNTGETVLLHKYALTILDENGDDFAPLVEYYDKLQKITSIEGALYDAEGKQLKKLKSKEIEDLSGVDDNNLMDDNRKKVHQFYYRTYPYTVEYEVETKFNNTLFFPTWVPQEGEHLSVEHSSYTIICPTDYEVRFRAFNYPAAPHTGMEGGKKILKWEVRQLPAISRPFAAPSWREQSTMVYFGPSAFEIQGYKGNMKSWQEFGKFVFSLKKDRDVLPGELVRKVAQLTAGLTDEKEKIRVLYEFLQQQTRYISIQLGLGGWQPFEASYVAKKGYGDCKALTNYMFSLLKAAGIKSYYALVRAGQGPKLMSDFPSQQFNHVILCAPVNKDTVWLECTSQTLPAGYLSSFTGNRYALLVDESGGVLVPTPRYSIQENTQLRHITAKLDPQANLELSVQTRYQALQSDPYHQMINGLSREKVEKVLQEKLELSTYNINKFSYAEEKSLLPQIREELDITVSRYATITGKRLFIQPNVMNRGGRRITVDSARTADFLFDEEWKDEDTYEIEIPEGYKLEASPQDLQLKTKFGTYQSSAKLVGNKILYHRVREQFSGRFPAKDGAELARFYEDIYKADRARMVLVKG